MNVKRLLAVSFCAVALAATAAVAERPGDRGGADDNKGDNKGARHEKWDRDARFREAMEKDWEAAQAHFREHSPLRAAAFDKMSDEQKEFFKPLIIGRHRGIKWLSRDPELLANKERQIKLEDDIFGVKTKLASVKEESDEAKTLKDSLRKSVEELVDARMAERALRIERLEMLIEDERELLKQDQLKRQSLIEKRMQDLLAAEVPVIDPPHAPPGAPPPPGDRRRPTEKRGD